MRKFLALVLALVMTMSLVTVSAGAATDFTDDAKIVNAEAVEVLNAIGILGGYADGSFRPQATLTRGAGAKMIAYLMLGQEKADNLKATYTVFADVTDGVALAPYIEWAAANGIVDGYGDGNFGPYNTLTEYAFGKMLLTAIGYDADEQGYTGAGWQKNVYRDALQSNVYDGTESYGACTRDTAARLVLATLETYYVVYGAKEVEGWFQINGTWYANANTDVLVNGVYETELAVWETYDGLEFDGFAFDTWGNLGDRWTYEDEEIGFYEDETVVTYTEQVDFCDLLVDLGVAENSSKKIALAVAYNGESVYAYGDVGEYYEIDVVSDEARFGHADEHYTCDERFVGGQGVLTKVFQLEGTNRFWATEVATYLAEVIDVSEKHNGTVATFEINWADLYAFGTDAVPARDNRDLHREVVAVDVDMQDEEATDAYAEGDYALVTVCNGEIIDHEAVTGTVGKLTRFTSDAAALEKDNFIGTTYVDGDKKMDAFGFRTGYADVKNGANLTSSFVFFYDAYGNVIGAVEPDTTTNYAVLDAVWSYHNNEDGAAVIKANVVTLDAVNNKGVNVVNFNDTKAANVLIEKDTAIVRGDKIVLEFASQNSDGDGAKHTFHIYTYSVDGANYTIEDAGLEMLMDVTHSTAADVIDELHYYEDGEIELTNLTKFVLRDVNGNYTAVTGYKNLPALSAEYAEVVLDDEDEATVVYLHDVVFAGDKLVGYIANGEPLAEVSYDSTEYYVYDFYVGDVAREVYVEKADFDTITANGTGLYEIQFNAVDGLLAVKAIVALDKDTDVKFYEDGWFVNYANNIAQTGKVTLTNGGVPFENLPVEDAMVYVVDCGNFTVKAGSLKDLADGADVEFVMEDGVLTAVYVLHGLYDVLV